MNSFIGKSFCKGESSKESFFAAVKEPYGQKTKKQIVFFIFHKSDLNSQEILLSRTIPSAPKEQRKLVSYEVAGLTPANDHVLK
jgi:hypothetical protein